MTTQLFLQIDNGPAVEFKRLGDENAYRPTSPYDVGRITLDVQKRITGLKVPKFFRGSGPSLGTGYQFVVGNKHNQFSNAHSVLLQASWKQNFSPYVFLTPQVGLSFTVNHLNFGAGYKPSTPQPALMFTAGFLAGGEIPINPNLSLLIYGGYRVNKTLAGAPFYIEHGPFGGAGLNFTLGDTNKKRQIEWPEES